MQNSAGDGNVTTERTFESIEGFIDCMQTTVCYIEHDYVVDANLF